jgi:superfamily II DNA/RNA helicase
VWAITRPTEIQAITIPEFLKGDNVLVAAQTGTGKTLSYALPMLERLYTLSQQKYYKRRGQRTRSIIVVPNRELGMQVQVRAINHLLLVVPFRVAYQSHTALSHTIAGRYQAIDG